MRLSRFFVDATLNVGEHELPEAQAHYISRVLRMSQGDAVQLFDGSGNEFRATLAEVGKKQVRVQVNESFAGQPESPLQIHLGQGLSRGERMDWAIQKATDLGVTQITPIISERCEVRLKDERAEKRQAHWQQIAISACEQCGRSVVPVIHAPATLADWLKQTEADLKLVLHPVAAPLTSHEKPGSLAFLIGPEGDFSDKEIQILAEKGIKAVSLGNQRLRTETAGIFVAAWNYDKIFLILLNFPNEIHRTKHLGT